MQASLNTVSKWFPFKVLTLIYPVLIQKIYDNKLGFSYKVVPIKQLKTFLQPTVC